MRRREVISAFAAVLASPFPVAAQENVPRIGYLTGSLATNPHLVEAFRKGLRDLGYVEGRNVVIEYRDAEGNYDRLPTLAAELVAARVDVIAATGTPHAMAAKQATATIPIVAVTADPVSSGLAATLARPGDNVTGLSLLVPDLVAKCVELLSQAVPGVARIAALWHPGDYGERTEANMIAGAEFAAQALGVRLRFYEVRGPQDFESTFARITATGSDALVVLGSNILIVARAPLVDLAAKNRLPTVYSYREFVDAGGLMSYGANFADLLRRAATYVDKLLKGAKASDLPIEQPTKLDLVINLKSAKALNLTIPPTLLARADEVIE
jgi:putative tryptophan/tyrosine transport system substrate-binding protein